MKGLYIQLSITALLYMCTVWYSISDSVSHIICPTTIMTDCNISSKICTFTHCNITAENQPQKLQFIAAIFVCSNSCPDFINRSLVMARDREGVPLSIFLTLRHVMHYVSLCRSLQITFSETHFLQPHYCKHTFQQNLYQFVATFV